MDLKIARRKALVTGRSGGIDEAVARRLAAEGAIVAINGRNPERPRKSPARFVKGKGMPCSQQVTLRAMKG